MIRKALVLLGAAISLAACASAGKRYEQGLELQRAGRPAEAAERYIEALKKDSRLDSARAGLRSSGAAAIEAYLRAAADPTTAPDAAAENFLAIDDLSRRALDVGIFLVPPDDYDARKRASFDRAINAAISDARRFATQRQFAPALRRLERAGTAYQPSGLQSSALGSAGADVALSWARVDTAEGRFRSAYARVDPIGALPGVTRAQVDEARAIQGLALARGTRRVAVVPAWATVTARRDLPEDALPALGDALLEEPWTSPPRFVAVVSQSQVDRELRRLGLSRRTLTTSEAARLGRATGADFVVVTEIDSVRREETGVRSTRRPARTRSGADTAYMVEEGTARLFAHATFVLVDGNGERVSDYQAFTAVETAPFTRARYAGDQRALDLRQSERDLFVRGTDDRALVQSFVRAMSARMGEAVFAAAVRQTP